VTDSTPTRAGGPWPRRSLVMRRSSDDINIPER